MMTTSDPIEAYKSNSSMNSILSQLKKSPVSSSILTPKHRTQILKMIEESIQ